jgi:hypothetical protein
MRGASLARDIEALPESSMLGSGTRPRVHASQHVAFSVINEQMTCRYSTSMCLQCTAGCLQPDLHGHCGSREGPARAQGAIISGDDS